MANTETTEATVSERNDDHPMPDSILGTPTRSAGELTEWGPYAEYQYVTTPHGEYGLQAGLVLSFEWVDKIDRETLEIVKVAKPVRRQATKDELERFGVDLSKFAPNKQIVEQAKKGEAPQHIDITINGEGTFPGVVKQAPVSEDYVNDGS